MSKIIAVYCMAVSQKTWKQQIKNTIIIGVKHSSVYPILGVI